MQKTYYVYMLASGRNGTLYIGSSSELAQRVFQHKHKLTEGFTATYDVSQLVWYEAQASAEAAVTRERQLKKWRRAWKLELIEKMNPYWIDLYEGVQ